MQVKFTRTVQLQVIFVIF